jgi:hypothetical protein
VRIFHFFRQIFNFFHKSFDFRLSIFNVFIIFQFVFSFHFCQYEVSEFNIDLDNFYYVFFSAIRKYKLKQKKTSLSVFFFSQNAESVFSLSFSTYLTRISASKLYFIVSFPFLWIIKSFKSLHKILFVRFNHLFLIQFNSVAG